MTLANPTVSVPSKKLSLTSKEPSVTSSERHETSEEIAVTLKELVVTSKESNVTSSECDETLKELVVTSKEPNVTSKESNVTSKESNVTSSECDEPLKELVVTSKEPVVTCTEEPSADIREETKMNADSNRRPYQVVLIKFLTPEENPNEDPFWKTLKENGISSSLANPLQIKYKNFNRLYDKLQHPESFSGMVFISPRGVNGVAECLNSFNDTLHPAWHDKPVYVFNGNTGKMVEEKLKIKAKGQATGTREKMTDFILSNGQLSKPLLMAHGSLNVSVGSFERRGIPYDSVNVYSRELHPDLQQQLDQLKNAAENRKLIGVFFSPYGMQLAQPYLPRTADASFIAVGRMTEKMAKELNIPLDKVCEKPCPDVLLSSIREIMNEDLLKSWCQDLDGLDYVGYETYSERSNGIAAF